MLPLMLLSDITERVADVIAVVVQRRQEHHPKPARPPGAAMTADRQRVCGVAIGCEERQEILVAGGGAVRPMDEEKGLCAL